MKSLWFFSIFIKSEARNDVIRDEIIRRNGLINDLEKEKAKNELSHNFWLASETRSKVPETMTFAYWIEPILIAILYEKWRNTLVIVRKFDHETLFCLEVCFLLWFFLPRHQKTIIMKLTSSKLL